MSDPAAIFQELLRIVERLRDPEHGCPWDREQTHASLKPYVIEEAYELVDAIDHEPQALQEELGDVLLQVVLHAQLAAEAETFTAADVLRTICDKLIRRHPHVFGGETVDSAAEVRSNWEKLKQEEKTQPVGRLDGIPRSLPALQRAHVMGERAAQVGFDWSGSEHVEEKVREELEEFLQCAREHTPQARQQAAAEFGDILFSLAQLARKLELNAEELLSQSCRKFAQRFAGMEERAGQQLSEMNLEQLDELWEQIKQEGQT